MSRSVVVIGAGMGGLSAAIHARLKGWDVLVLEQSDRTGGKAAGIEMNGFWLDPGPSIIIMPEIYREVFRRAGKNPDDYLVFDRLPVLSRVYFEGEETVDIPGDREGAIALLERIAPKDATAFTAMMAKLDGLVGPLEHAVFERPILGWADMLRPGLLKFGLRFNPFRSYKDMIDGWFQSPLLRAFFYGFPSYSGQSYRDNAPGALIIPYKMLQEGVYFPRGGVRSIPAAFERLARELGVEIRFGQKFRTFEDCGVRLDSGEVIETDDIICNVDKCAIEPPAKANPSMSYFTRHWGLKCEIGGLEHHTLLIPRDFERGFEQLYNNSLPDPPIIYLNATTRLDPKAAPLGHTNLFSVVTVPSDGPALNWQRDAEPYGERIRSELAKFGFEWPVENEIFERKQDPRYFEAAHGNFRGSLYGPTQKHRHLGLFPLSNQGGKLGKRGRVVYCGGTVQPGAGLPMVTLSGKFAVDLLD